MHHKDEFEYGIYYVERSAAFMQLSNLTNNTNPEHLTDFPSIGRGWMFELKYNFKKTDDTAQ